MRRAGKIVGRLKKAFWIIMVVGVLMALFVMLVVEFWDFRQQKINKVFQPQISPLQLHAPKQWRTNPPSFTRQKMIKIILFGDSRVAEWESVWPEGVDVLNQGVSGSTSSESLQRLEDDVLSLKPQWIVVQVGINDVVASRLVWSEKRKEIENRVIENTLTLIRRCLNHNINIVYFSILPALSPDWMRKLVWKGDLSQSVKRVNQGIEKALKKLRLSDEFARSNGSLTIIDTALLLKQFRTEKRSLQTSEQENPQLKWHRDALHWTPAAYDRLQKKVMAILK